MKTTADISTPDLPDLANVDLWHQNKCLACQSKHFSESAWNKHTLTESHKKHAAVYDFLTNEVASFVPCKHVSAVSQLLSSEPGAYIGVDCLHEFVFNEYQERFWACSVCFCAGFQISDVIAHLNSAAHRTIYIDEYYPTRKPKGRNAKEKATKLNAITQEISSEIRLLPDPEVFSLSMAPPVAAQRLFIQFPVNCQQKETVNSNEEESESKTLNQQEGVDVAVEKAEEKSISSSIEPLTDPLSPRQPITATVTESAIQPDNIKETINAPLTNGSTDASSIPSQQFTDYDKISQQLHLQLTGYDIISDNRNNDFVYLFCKSCWEVCRFPRPFSVESTPEHENSVRHKLRQKWYQLATMKSREISQEYSRFESEFISSSKNEWEFDSVSKEFLFLGRVLGLDYVIHRIKKFPPQMYDQQDLLCQLCLMTFPTEPFSEIACHIRSQNHILQFLHKNYPKMMTVLIGKDGAKQREIIGDFVTKGKIARGRMRVCTVSQLNPIEFTAEFEMEKPKDIAIAVTDSDKVPVKPSGPKVTCMEDGTQVVWCDACWLVLFVNQSQSETCESVWETHCGLKEHAVMEVQRKLLHLDEENFVFGQSKLTVPELEPDCTEKVNAGLDFIVERRRTGTVADVLCLLCAAVMPLQDAHVHQHIHSKEHLLQYLHSTNMQLVKFLNEAKLTPRSRNELMMTYLQKTPPRLGNYRVYSPRIAQFLRDWGTFVLRDFSRCFFPDDEIPVFDTVMTLLDRVAQDNAEEAQFTVKDALVAEGIKVIDVQDDEAVLFCSFCWEVILVKKGEPPIESICRTHLKTEKHLRKKQNRVVLENSLVSRSFVKKRPTFTVPELTAGTSNKKLTWRKKHGAENFEFAYRTVGLQYLIERRSFETGSGDPDIICTLCLDTINFNQNDLASHVRSMQHVLQFMHKEYPMAVRNILNLGLCDKGLRQAIATVLRDQPGLKNLRGEMRVYDPQGASIMRQKAIQEQIDMAARKREGEKQKQEKLNKQQESNKNKISKGNKSASVTESSKSDTSARTKSKSTEKDKDKSSLRSSSSLSSKKHKTDLSKDKKITVDSRHSKGQKSDNTKGVVDKGCVEKKQPKTTAKSSKASVRKGTGDKGNSNAGSKMKRVTSGEKTVAGGQLTLSGSRVEQRKALIEKLATSIHHMLPESEKPSSLNLNIQASAKKGGPAIGVGQVCEILCEDDASFRSYLCLPCRVWSSASELVTHLFTDLHRKEYLKTYYPAYYKSVSTMTNESAVPSLLRQYAQRIVATCEPRQEVVKRSNCMVDRKALFAVWYGYKSPAPLLFNYPAVLSEPPPPPPPGIVNEPFNAFIPSSKTLLPPGTEFTGVRMGKRQNSLKNISDEEDNDVAVVYDSRSKKDSATAKSTSSNSGSHRKRKLRRQRDRRYNRRSRSRSRTRTRSRSGSARRRVSTLRDPPLYRKRPAAGQADLYLNIRKKNKKIPPAPTGPRIVVETKLKSRPESWDEQVGSFLQKIGHPQQKVQPGAEDIDGVPLVVQQLPQRAELSPPVDSSYYGQSTNFDDYLSSIAPEVEKTAPLEAGDEYDQTAFLERLLNENKVAKTEELLLKMLLDEKKKQKKQAEEQQRLLQLLTEAVTREDQAGKTGAVPESSRPMNAFLPFSYDEMEKEGIQCKKAQSKKIGLSALAEATYGGQKTTSSSPGLSLIADATRNVRDWQKEEEEEKETSDLREAERLARLVQSGAVSWESLQQLVQKLHGQNADPGHSLTEQKTTQFAPTAEQQSSVRQKKRKQRLDVTAADLYPKNTAATFISTPSNPTQTIYSPALISTDNRELVDMDFGEDGEAAQSVQDQPDAIPNIMPQTVFAPAPVAAFPQPPQNYNYWQPPNSYFY